MPDHELIRANGWRQGRIFSPEDTATILEHCEANARLILVSHDCDVVHAGDDEPYVEVCVASHLEDGVDGLYRWARNPRRLDIEVQLDGAPVGFSLLACDKQRVSRTELERCVPDQSASLSTRELAEVAIWLGKRYTRVALPDGFNERRRPANDAVRRILRRSSQFISGLMIALNPKGDIGPEHDYEVHFVALMLKDDYQDDHHRNRVEEAVNRIADRLQACDDIEVIDSAVRSEEMFTYHDARYFVELGFDDLSLRADPEHPRLP